VSGSRQERLVVGDVWAVGERYETYMGRWSRRLGEAFLRWLDPPTGGRWLDVGCGTGALTAAVLAVTKPAEILGVDPSPGFLATARSQATDPRARFRVGDAQDLALPDRYFDGVVSGLTLNFVPDPPRAAAEFARVAAAGGIVAAYVWDYAEGMAMIRHFWDAAETLTPAAAALDEAHRFPLCRPQNLQTLWANAGLRDVVVQPISIPTVFADFDDYWAPFLGGQGPAAGYVASLSEEHQAALRELLRTRLPARPDNTIALGARAWAVRGIAP
jgi:ubiquinone/menaquinone biosynthesis C-methylase UbiE